MLEGLSEKVDRYGYFWTLVWIVTAIGALNWGLVELAEFNLVTELLPPDFQGIAYLLVGAAGLVNLADLTAGVDL
jgi:uncharacterized membrane protein YuzA (DUF378 family)